MKLRVVEPENTFWRRGIQACVRYVTETGADQLPVPYDYVTPDDWAPARFPLGTWFANKTKSHKAGHLNPGQVEQLDMLGMVWSHQDVAFEEGLTAARAWAKVHGHLLPPAIAVWDGNPVGAWTKNQHFADRITDTNTQRREAGLPVESGAGVEFGMHPESGAGSGRGNGVHDGLVAGQGTAAPVHDDVGRQPVLDLVPLRCARRQVAHGDPVSAARGGQFRFPGAGAVAVGAARIRSDQQSTDVRVTTLAA